MLCPMDLNHLNLRVCDAGAVGALRAELVAAGARVTDVEDHRPAEEYVTFRRWGPDGTEVEVFWEGP